MKMEEEKGERVCGFLKIVFEGFVFFLTENPFTASIGQEFYF